MADSSNKKPQKPYPGFPLYAHASGRWAKKIRNRLHYFGPWADPFGSLKKYEEQRDRLHAGLPPRDPAESGTALGDALNHFLTVQKHKLNLGEIAPRTYRDYERTCDLLVSHFGRDRLVQHLLPHDLDAYRVKLSATRNVRTLGNEVNRVRIALKHIHDAGFVAEPIKYSKQFSQPSKAVLRKHRAKQGKKMFQPGEVRQLVLHAHPTLAAMILLGINCGFGPGDCAAIPLDRINLDTGWHDYARPKTGIERSCPLWPETIEAVCDYLSLGRSARDGKNSDRLFLTRHGRPFNRESDYGTITKGFSRLAKSLEITGTFYWLRHTFETVAGMSRDQVAVNHIMGHVDASMAGEYREEVQPERLQAVANVVRDWIDFGASTAESHP